MKQYCTHILVVLLFLAAGVHAQSITGDTIYVNTKMEVSVSFPSRVSDFYTNPVDAPYNIKTFNDRSATTISAKNKNTLPASLTVVEGKRTHLFFIVFKKNISFSNTQETHLDYSTMQKLEDHVKQVAASRALDKKYTVLKTSAENNIEQKKYKEAQEDCLQMLNLKPGFESGLWWFTRDVGLEGFSSEISSEYFTKTCGPIASKSLFCLLVVNQKQSRTSNMRRQSKAIVKGDTVFFR